MDHAPNALSRRTVGRAALATALASVFPARAAEPPPSLPAYAGPWTPLFNGRDLDGWTFFQDGVGQADTTKAVSVGNGVIHMLGPKHSGTAAPGFGHIATTREYGDYHLRLQYRFGEARFEPRLLAKRNSGILYHMFPARDRVWPNSIEFQLQESDVGDAILINTRCWPGADLGGTPAWPVNASFAARPTFPPPANPRPAIERQSLKKNGSGFERLQDWNTIELIAYGDRAAHLVNGRIVNTIYDIVGQEVTDRNVYRPLTRGRIGLEIEGAEVMFRNIEIRLFSKL